jgi:OOP family OmpA-OmpF porin
MKKQILCLALLGAMGAAQAVMAQDFDDRWYLDGSVGYNFQDKARDDQNGFAGVFGVGKYIGPDWSIELNANGQSPRENSGIGHWSQYGVSLDALYHFHAGAHWNPYVRAGVGWEHDREPFLAAVPGGVATFDNTDNHVAGVVGLGLESNYGRYGARVEFGARIDGDDNSVTAPDRDRFVDLLASVGMTVALGPEPIKAVEPAPMAPPPPPPPPQPKCPNVPPGTTVDADGCPVPVTIDLRGVNFDFDKSKLRPDAVEILGQAVEVLKKYPQMRVEVAGHTDSIGSDAYNQKLSQRRAKAVYEYLTSNGVDASRLVGPNGYGKTRPIAPNTNPDGSDNPQGRAQNRRTELNVQN